MNRFDPRTGNGCATGRDGGSRWRVRRALPVIRLGDRAARLTAAALLLLTGCGVQQSAPDPDIPATATSVPFVSLAELQYSSIDQAGRVTVKTAVDWANLWSAATEVFEPAEDPPAVDFRRRMVLLAAMGRRPTGGYDIRIGAVYEDSERIYAVFTEVSPGLGCLTSQAFTAPVSAVSVSRSEKPVLFIRRTDTRNCD